jgi:hypothetical protein
LGQKGLGKGAYWTMVEDPPVSKNVRNSRRTSKDKTDDVFVKTQNDADKNYEMFEFQDVNIDIPLETSEVQPDSCDLSRPKISYADIITAAILSSPEKELKIGAIFEYFEKEYEYYRVGSWQVAHPFNLEASVRSTLSSHPKFIRAFRETGPNECSNAVWRVNEDFEEPAKKLKKEKNAEVFQTISTSQNIPPCETIDPSQSNSPSGYPLILTEPITSVHPRKPTDTYYEIIRAAIESAPEKRITLQGIYNYAIDNYDFFTNTGN